MSEDGRDVNTQQRLQYMQSYIVAWRPCELLGHVLAGFLIVQICYSVVHIYIAPARQHAHPDVPSKPHQKCQRLRSKLT